MRPDVRIPMDHHTRQVNRAQICKKGNQSYSMDVILLNV